MKTPNLDQLTMSSRASHLFVTELLISVLQTLAGEVPNKNREQYET